MARAPNISPTKIRGLQRLGGFGGVADMMDRYNQYLGDPGYLPKDIARYQAVTTGFGTGDRAKSIWQGSAGGRVCGAGEEGHRRRAP